MKKIILLAALSAVSLSSCGYIFNISGTPNVFPTIEIDYKGKNLCSKPQLINESPVLRDDQYFELSDSSIYETNSGYKLIAKLTPPNKIAKFPLENLTKRYRFTTISPTLFRGSILNYAFNTHFKCDDTHEPLQVALKEGSRIILEEDSTKYTGYSYTVVKDVVSY